MKDKKYHVLAGLLIAAAVGLPAYLESLNLFAGIWAAIASGIIAAGIKEWCDMHADGNRWDWRDFVSSVIGVAVVAVFIILLHFGKG